MLIIGDEYIPYEKIESIVKMDDIQNTSSNSTVVFRFDKDIMKYCMENSVPYCVKISSIKEAVFANSLNAKYLIASNKLVQSIQHLAENYMFDTKVLAVIKSEDDIEQFAAAGIDGVIYNNLVA